MTNIKMIDTFTMSKFYLQYRKLPVVTRWGIKLFGLICSFGIVLLISQLFAVAIPANSTNLVVVVTLISGFMTTIGSLLGSRTTETSSNKTIYITTVTDARRQYISEAKEIMAEFCANAKNYNSSHRATGDFKQLVKSKNKISYQLNAKDKFDQIILFRIAQVMDAVDEGSISVMDEILDELTRLTQIWMKFEWEGVKLEAKYGSIPEEEKQQLWDKYLNQEVRNFECQLAGKPELKN